MDEECDLNLSTSYMLSVSRVAESCIGKKIINNDFTLPHWTLKKRAKLWNTITSKYSVYEDDDTCEIALEVEVNTKIQTEYVPAGLGPLITTDGAGHVTRSKMRCNEFRQPLVPNLKKRKLKDRDAVLADLYEELDKPTSTDSEVPQHVQQATASLLDDGSRIEELHENLREDFMADILSGSLKSRPKLRNNSSTQSKDVSGGGDKNDGKMNSSCRTALEMKYVKQPAYSINKPIEENRNYKSYLLRGERCSYTEDNKKSLSFGGNKKEVMVAASREVSDEQMQNVLVDETLVPAQLDRCEENSSFDKAGKEDIKVGVNNTRSLPSVSRKASITSVTTASASSIEETKSNRSFHDFKHVQVTTNNVLSREIVVNDMLELAFESMPLSVWRTFGASFKLWMPQVILKKCDGVVSTTNKNKCMSFDRKVSDENMSKHSEVEVVRMYSSKGDQCTDVYAPESISSSSEVLSNNAVVGGTNLSNSEQPHHKTNLTFEHSRIVDDSLEECVNKCVKSSHSETQLLRKEDDIPVCRDNSSSRANYSCEGRKSKHSVDCTEPNQVRDTEGETKLLTSVSTHLQQKLKHSLDSCSKGAADESDGSRNIGNNSETSFCTARSTEACRRNGQEVSTTVKTVMLQTCKAVFTKYKDNPVISHQNISKVNCVSVGSDCRNVLGVRDKNFPFHVNQKNALCTENIPVVSNVVQDGEVCNSLVSSAPCRLKDVRNNETNQENIKHFISASSNLKFVNHVKFLNGSGVKTRTLTSPSKLLSGQNICSEVSNKITASSRGMEMKYHSSKQVGKFVDCVTNSSRNPRMKNEHMLESNFKQSSSYQYVHRESVKHISSGSSRNKENVRHKTHGNIRSPIHNEEYQTSNSKQPTKDLKYFDNKIKKTKRKSFHMKIVSPDNDNRVCMLDFS